MTPLTPDLSRYERMTPDELAEATRALDEELVVERSLPLSPADRRLWEKARRKPGRPRHGEGVRVVSVSIERRLLARTDALARRLGVSRAAVVSKALGDAVSHGRATLAETSRRRAPQLRGARFVACIDDAGAEASLERNKIYLALADPAAARSAQVRVLLDTGDDYLFAARRFRAIALPEAVRLSVVRSVVGRTTKL